MSVSLQNRLENRLALRIGVSLGLFVLVLGVGIFGFGYRKQMADAMSRQDQLAHTVLNSAAVAAFARNQAIADDVIRGLTGNSYVMAARIDGQDGFTHTQARLSAFDWQQAQATDYPLTSPLSDTDVIGTLRIVPDTERMRSDALVYGMGYAALPILEILAATGIIVFLIRKFVGRPVAALAIGLSAIDPRVDKGARVPVPPGHDNDEIGLLARSANRLIAATENALEQERALREQVQAMEARYRHIFQTTNIGIMVLNGQGRLINSNPALLDKVVGLALSNEQATAFPDFLTAIFQHPQAAWDLVQQSVADGHSVTADLQLQAEPGEVARWVHAIFSVSQDAQGQIEGIEAVLYDVTARRQKEDEVRLAAERDPLTGLHNRRGYEIFLDRALRRAGDDGSALCVMLLDLDGFKQVNDQQGHAAGDEVLKVVAQRLQSRARRNSDLVGRLGGDEFVIIRYDSGTDRATLGTLAAELVTLVAQPIEVGPDTLVQVGASIGLALYPSDGSTRNTLIQAADDAMYTVKRHGKNSFAWAPSGSDPA